LSLHIFSEQNELERVDFFNYQTFVAISWMAKATVQAALGPVALKHLAIDHPHVVYGETVLMVCILAIVVTAPLGAILISITGTKLLTKTKPHVEPAEGE
jgi:hypothetical protein